jgi:hypothetical protein
MSKKPQEPKTNGADAVKLAELPFVRSAEFKSIYANFARINFNAFEVSMLFGHAGVMPEKQDTATVEMTARVTLSVIEAKLLMQMLNSTIENFEKKYGRVTIPDDVKLPVERKTEGV